MTKTIPWTTGSGNIILTYNGGQGNDSVVVTTDTDNTGIDRQQTLTFKTTNNAVTQQVTVSQEGNGYKSMYLTFIALEAGTFTFTATRGGTIDYSLDNGSTWTALASGTASPTVNAGSKIMWRGNCSAGTSSTGYGIGTFSSTGTFNVEGNIMSMLYGDSFSDKVDLSAKSRPFWSLFNGCTTIINAKHLVLPATTLASYCYYQMFMDCTNLVTAPRHLPATTLTSSCYSNMFRRCTSLTTAPAIAATTTAYACCRYMFTGCANIVESPVLLSQTLAELAYGDLFNGCSKLNKVICLATNISASNCCQTWLKNVSASGTFIKAANMTSWPRTTSGIPSGWTVQDYVE